MDNYTDLRLGALACHGITDPLRKVEQTQKLYHQWLADDLILTDDDITVPDVAGHPDKPELVAPRDLPILNLMRVI